MINEQHAQWRSESQRDVLGQKEVTEALPPMDLRADIGNQCKCGCIEKGQTNTLKDPHHQEGPKRGRKEISGGSEGKEEGAGDHKALFGDPEKGSSNERSQDQ